MHLKRTVFLLISLILLTACSAPIFASVLPPADREESERLFALAYDFFLKRDYASSLSNLDMALRMNTYLVDYYLMRGLVLHRLGRTEEAVKSIRYYLEVRPRDSAAPRIMARYSDEDFFVREFLSGEPIESRILSSRKDIKNTFSLGMLQTLGVLGLGKTSSYADGFFIADTQGNRVGLRFPGENRFQFIETESPVVAFPMGNKSMYILSESGDLYFLAEGERLPTLLGNIQETPSDGVLIANDLIAVSSNVSRTVSLFSIPGLTRVGELSFPEREHLFEPVALAFYGGWLAVADRSNGRVHIQFLQDETLFLTIEADAPRDLVWSSLGDLFILHESGSVSRARISFSRRSVVELETILPDAQDGWNLFSLNDRIYCMDISASRLWEMFPAPKGDAFAMLSLSSPTISREQDRESFILDATVSGPFLTYMSLNKPVVTSVWNERLLGGGYVPTPSGHQGMTLYFKPPEGNRSRDEGVHAASGREVLSALMESWHTRKGDIGNIVVTASTPFSFEEIVQLAGFCLQNRIRIFVHADTVPSLELLRAAAITSGRDTFVAHGTWGVHPMYSTGRIRIVLPADESSSGFPSRSTLSVYLDIGVVLTRDWIPLWPDLL